MCSSIGARTVLRFSSITSVLTASSPPSASALLNGLVGWEFGPFTNPTASRLPGDDAGLPDHGFHPLTVHPDHDGRGRHLAIQAVKAEANVATGHHLRLR